MREPRNADAKPYSGAELSGHRSERARQAGLEFRKNYLQCQYAFVEFFTQHLIDLFRAFGGDLQEMLVFAVIGQVYIRGTMDRKQRNAAIDDNPALSSIHASRIRTSPASLAKRSGESCCRFNKEAGSKSWTMLLGP